MERMPRFRKRSFLLLELVIALSLIALCLFPLLRSTMQFTQITKRQIQQDRAYLEERLVLCQIKEALFSQTYSWEQLKKGVSSPSYTLRCMDVTDREALGRQGLLLEATTAFGQHQLYVEREG